MARTKQTARKYTGGRVPRGALAVQGPKPREVDTFLEDQDHTMPSLLWRVLSNAGYTVGMEPQYYWDSDELVNDGEVTVEVYVPPMDGDTPWVGWRCFGTGKTAKMGATFAAFEVMEHLMEEVPDQLAHALPGIFPFANRFVSWAQAEEAHGSHTPAMSAMFAVQDAYRSMETLALRQEGEFKEASKEARKEKRKLTRELQRSQEEVARVSQQRDKVVKENKKMAQARDEAWSELCRLNHYQQQLMSDMDGLREYNVNLHEGLHRKQEKIRQLKAEIAALKGEGYASSESSNDEE